MGFLKKFFGLPHKMLCFLLTLTMALSFAQSQVSSEETGIDTSDGLYTTAEDEILEEITPEIAGGVDEAPEETTPEIVSAEDETQPVETPVIYDFTYDPQPATLEQVRAEINEAEYQAALAAGGFRAAVAVPKPHWQYYVAAELMPALTAYTLINVTIGSNADVRFIHVAGSHLYNSLYGISGSTFKAEAGSKFLLYDNETDAAWGAFWFANIELNNVESFVVVNASVRSVGYNAAKLTVNGASSICYYSSGQTSSLFNTGTYAYMPSRTFNRWWANISPFNVTAANWTGPAAPTLSVNTYASANVPSSPVTIQSALSSGASSGNNNISQYSAAAYGVDIYETICTLAYDGNNADSETAPASDAGVPNDLMTAAGNTGNLVRDNYTFAGWNTAAGGGTYYNVGTTFRITEDMRLYAVWESDPNLLATVTYYANDGTSAMVSEQALKDADYTVLTNSFSNGGFTFTGWNTREDGDGMWYREGEVITLTGDITLYAQWEEVSAGGTVNYTLTVTNNGDEDMSKIVVTDCMLDDAAGLKVTGPGGNLALGTDYSVSGATITIDENFVLAVGESLVITYSVTFDASGTYENHAEVTAVYLNQTVMAEDDETVELDPVYTVTYDGNGNTGGTAPVDETRYESSETVTVKGREDLVKDGSVFIGWNTEANGSGTPYSPNATFKITGDTTLYAQWEEVSAATLVFRKIDAATAEADDVTPLEGAEFELYYCGDDTHEDEGSHIPLGETGTCWVLSDITAAYNGSVVIFEGLEDGFFLLMETMAPDGYQLPKGQWIIRVEDGKILFVGTSGNTDVPAVVASADFGDRESEDSVGFWIGNIEQYELPVAGNGGTFLFAAVGYGLMTTGMFMISIYRRRRPEIGA